MKIPRHNWPRFITSFSSQHVNWRFRKRIDLDRSAILFTFVLSTVLWCKYFSQWPWEHPYVETGTISTPELSSNTPPMRSLDYSWSYPFSNSLLCPASHNTSRGSDFWKHRFHSAAYDHRGLKRLFQILLILFWKSFFGSNCRGSRISNSSHFLRLRFWTGEESSAGRQRWSQSCSYELPISLFTQQLFDCPQWFDCWGFRFRIPDCWTVLNISFPGCEIDGPSLSFSRTKREMYLPT
jgi:hypothetical protein